MDSYSIDEKILEFLIENEGRDIIQSEISKTLGLNSKEVSRVIKKLEDEGLIQREPLVYKGRRTYRIIVNIHNITEQGKTSLYATIVKRKLVENIVQEVVEIPCVYCPYINRCYEGGFYDPTNCQFINEWFKTRIKHR
ncbi:MarR family transcriptional regulator [Thermogladius sp. 4427co]|uniref:helix-turn-helix transcriptional regulator n=1 Tax=Thermogladius sp. 4427co TaxID=3450718 RepID=UPI003F7AD946